MKIQTEKNKYKSFGLQFAFGGMGALVSKTVASPLQIVKLRLQVQEVLIEKGVISHHYQGILDCIKRLFQENGVSAFFKGNLTNVSRYFITQALNFSLRDFFRHIQSEKFSINLSNLSFLQNLVAGGVAGGLTQLIVYPLDYVRTRLANQLQKGSPHHYKNFVDCLSKTYKSDGLKGLYRGFVITCNLMVIYRGLTFGIYDTLRPYIPKQHQQNMLYTFALGYFATIVGGSISYPLDTIRRRLMMTSGQATKFKKNYHCFVKIWQEGGWKAFFKGGLANAISGITGAAVYSVYDRIKVFYLKRNGQY